MFLSTRAIVPLYRVSLCNNIFNHINLTMSEQVDQPPILPPPFVNIPGIANLRDIGGYNPGTKTHQSTRRNLVYRSADPSKVTPDGLAKLKELGVKKVFDLRSIPEIHKQGPEWAGVEVEKADVFYVRPEGSNEPIPEGEIERVWCPVFRDKDYGPEQVALRFSNYARSGNEVCYCPIMIHDVL